MSTKLPLPKSLAIAVDTAVQWMPRSSRHAGTRLSPQVLVVPSCAWPREAN
eukprot:UN3101